MKRSDIKFLPVYFDRYIMLVEDIELTDALAKYSPEILLAKREKLINAADKTYAPGKWTVKEIIQHLIDSERVFNYRSLRFARNDKTVLPGYEEDKFALESDANRRSVDDLLNEFSTLRKSTLDLFNSFDTEMLYREGICYDKNISVLALGFVMAGHLLHHTNVIEQKYLSL